MGKFLSWFWEHRIIITAVTVLGAISGISLLTAIQLINAPSTVSDAQAATSWKNQRPYSDDSPWNTPIGTNPVYDPYSDEMIQTLARTSTGGRIGSDPTRYTYPVYFADNSTPRFDIPCLKTQCSIYEDGQLVRVDVLESVPVPPGARPAGGRDSQMIIIDTVTGQEYGLFHASWIPVGWQADNGYRYDLTEDGTAEGFGSRGAGVPYYAGLIRPWEIRAGVIEHAIAFAYDTPAIDRCVWPASKTDGTNDDPYAIPEGARLQLNPNLGDADFDGMGLTSTARIVARALQTYGMILIDTGGSPKIMAEDLVDNPLTTDSWDALDLRYTDDLIAGIPYHEFQVLKLPDAYWDAAASSTFFGKCLREP